MKNTKYLYLCFAFCALTINCKKDLSNDIPAPIIETGSHYPQNELIIGEIQQVSPYLYQYGHVWEEHPTSPIISVDATASRFFSSSVTDEIDVTTFEANATLPIKSDVSSMLPGYLYNVRSYWIDKFGNVEYGDKLSVYIP